jgi:hypothetical protein
MIPCTLCSKAVFSQLFGDDPYNGLLTVGKWLRENRQERRGA